MILSPPEIAQVAHEANRATCHLLGDHSQVCWEDAPDWQRASALNGVYAILEGRVTTPAGAHESWLGEKVAAGWVYGPEKDPVQKTHPCMLPFESLPAEQQIKDRLFFAIVNALGAL